MDDDIKKKTEGDKKCLNCDREVEYLHANKIYCSQKCGREYRKKKNQENTK